MKTIMVLSGGTATAWSICEAVRSVASSKVKLIVCDTNPEYLVHTSILADAFFTVPPIKSEGYYEYMLQLMKKLKVNILIPLIDLDLQLFPRDNPILVKMGIFSTAPVSHTFQALSDKKKLYNTLIDLDIPTPRLYEKAEIEPNITYFVKPQLGFGSRNARSMLGKDILAQEIGECIIQEICTYPELTADIFACNHSVLTACRERIETKAGVCTKARVFACDEISEEIKKLAAHLPLPEVCCMQFMKGMNGKWLLTDCNLRLGAGSALSAAVGFCAAKAAVANWLNMPKITPIQPETEKYVLRHYTEIVTK